jgi:hypothetical protein
MSVSFERARMLLNRSPPPRESQEARCADFVLRNFFFFFSFLVHPHRRRRRLASVGLVPRAEQSRLGFADRPPCNQHS